MAESARKPKATTLDELYGLSGNPVDHVPKGLTASEVIVEMPMEQIYDFHNHPYRVRLDAITRGIVQDIEQTGRLEQAGIVRPGPDGTYELIAGHRRKLACTIAGRPTLPVVIREMSDDEAIICMVRSNTQREQVLPSEKAFAYKMRSEAEKRQGERTDLTSSPLGTKLRTDEKIAKDNGESRTTIQRYIRLTNLIPSILQMIDNKVLKTMEDQEPEKEEKEKGYSGSLGIHQGEQISFLSQEEQELLYSIMQVEDRTPSLEQAKRLHKFSEEGTLTQDVMLSVLIEDKPNQKEVFKIKQEQVSKYIPKSYTPKQAEEYIIKALQYYHRYRQRQQQER